MSRSLFGREICERALRLVGQFPITESAPDGEHLREALFWLDLILAEIAGTHRVFFLVPTTKSLFLVAGEQSYNLSSTLGDEYPTDGIQFPVDAWIEDSGANRAPIQLVTRQAFESHPKSDESGVPVEAYIDRLASPTLHTFPTLPSTATETYTIKLVVQTFAPNVAPSGVSGTRPQGTALHGFRQAWQRYLIYRLARDLGSGAIIKLPDASLKRYQEEGERAERPLLAFENREHDTEEPIVEPHGM